MSVPATELKAGYPGIYVNLATCVARFEFRNHGVWHAIIAKAVSQLSRYEQAAFGFEVHNTHGRNFGAAVANGNN